MTNYISFGVLIIDRKIPKMENKNTVTRDSRVNAELRAD